MKLNSFYQNAFYSLLGLIVGFIIAASMFYQPAQTVVQIDTQPIEKVQTFPSDTLKLLALNDENLMKELIRQNVKHPEIVLAQAKLETGHYTSSVCKNKNNLFGLKGKKGYYCFDDWRESVKAYRDYVQYKYKGGDYFQFLENIGYAEEKNYVKYVKNMMTQNNDQG